MNRKTRKLIWSAPLVAVLAIAGVLAIFVALSPQEAAAHEAAMHGPPGPVTGLNAAQAADDLATGEPKGRTQIMLTWMMPAAGMGDPATSYRIDYSDDTRIWRNLMPMVADASADMYCGADAAAAMRCFTDMTPKPGMERHYRVFAMNALGIGPISVKPTYATAKTLDYANPSPVLGLTATTHHVDMIELNWQPPTDSGGAGIVWYCLAVGTTDANIEDPTDATNEPDCLNANTATDGDVAVGVDTIVVAGDTTTYTQAMLSMPPVISQYYRVYAVSDVDGNAMTDNDDMEVDRRITMAASNIANGRTVAPFPTINTDVTETPGRVTNLRWVGNLGTDGVTAELRLYWTLPSNYPDAPVGVVTQDNPDLRDNWSVEVARFDSAATDPDDEWVVETGDGPPSRPAQWSSATDEVDELEIATQEYRVRYINNAGTVGDTEDDAPGEGFRFTVTHLTDDVFNENLLPKLSESTDNVGVGLRFAHNEVHPDVWLDLIWTEEENSSGDVPTGYEIDVTIDTTIDENTIWRPVRNQPIDLGATRQYTHKGVIPGDKYTYRVFPEFGGNFGIPATEEASSRGAKEPAPVRGLTVTANPANPQTSLVLNWPMVSDNGGHDIMHYLVQIAQGDINNNTTLDGTVSLQNWVDLGMTDDATETTFTYSGSDSSEGPITGFNDPLAGGYVRWFRVFAITVENDGDDTTGGTAKDVTNGEDSATRSDDSASPTPADIAGADPKPGMTDAPRASDDPTQIGSPPAPVDLTAEQASDTNLPGAGDRGVLLLWNEPMNASGITGYLIQRKVDDGGWITIGNIAWVGMNDFHERTSFTDSREYIEGEDLYYQVGSRGASTVEPTYAMPVMYPTTHTDHAFSAPSNVAATSTGGTITVMWTPGAQSASQVIVAVNAADTTDYCLHVETSGTLDSHDCEALTVGANYVVLVIALDGQGGYMVGRGANGMIVTHTAQ